MTTATTRNPCLAVLKVFLILGVAFWPVLILWLIGCMITGSAIGGVAVVLGVVGLVYRALIVQRRNARTT